MNSATGGGQSVEREGERCAQQSVKYHSACTETDEVALKSCFLAKHGAANLLLRGALFEVLLEGLAGSDGALLAEGVVGSGHGGGVIGVSLLVGAPPSIHEARRVTSILRRLLGEEGGHAALRRRGGR